MSEPSLNLHVITEVSSLCETTVQSLPPFFPFGFDFSTDSLLVPHARTLCHREGYRAEDVLMRPPRINHPLIFIACGALYKIHLRSLNSGGPSDRVMEYTFPFPPRKGFLSFKVVP